jgi:hypothetical protein
MEEWVSIEDLLQEAVSVKSAYFVYRGKRLKVHWMELTLGESPSFSHLLAGKDVEEMQSMEMMEIGERMSEELAFSMIQKGQKTEGVRVWTHDEWGKLPYTLRREIVAEITTQKKEVAQRF